MRTIDAEEVQARFAEVLRDIENGETVVAVRGVPVAQFVPIQKGYQDAAETIDEWERYRDEHNVVFGGGFTVREIIEGDGDFRFEWVTRSGRDEDDRGE